MTSKLIFAFLFCCSVALPQTQSAEPILQMRPKTTELRQYKNPADGSLYLFRVVLSHTHLPDSLYVYKTEGGKDRLILGRIVKVRTLTDTLVVPDAWTGAVPKEAKLVRVK